MTETPQRENGHVEINNENAEQFAKTHFSGNEWQIIWVVLRKTWGWNKKEDEISLTQFQKLTGLARPSVTEAVDKLVGKKVLLINKDGYINKYSFNKLQSEWIVPKKELVGFSQHSREKGTTPVPKKEPKLVPKKEHTIDNKDNNTKDNRAKALQDKPEVFGNLQVNLIMETYKKNMGFYPTDRKPRFVANNMRLSINSFCKEWGKLHPELNFEYLLEKIFVWFMKRDQIKGETLDVVRRKMKMLLEVKAEAYRKEVIQDDKPI